MDKGEENIKEKYNLELYTNTSGTINLNKDGKYKLYISNDNYK